MKTPHSMQAQKGTLLLKGVLSPEPWQHYATSALAVESSELAGAFKL